MQDERYGNNDNNVDKENNAQNVEQNTNQSSEQSNNNTGGGYYGQPGDGSQRNEQDYGQTDGGYNANQGYGPNNAGGFNGMNGNNGFNNFNQSPKKNNSGKKKIAVAACVAASLGVFAIGGMGVRGVISYLDRYNPDSGQLAWENQDESNRTDKNTESPSATTAPVSVTKAGASAGAVTDVSGIVEGVMPCVVSITSTASVQGYSIFGQRYEQEISSAGTGFIVGENDEELLLATNNHVVENATAIQVTFCDESTAQVVVKGTDAQADLAVVAVKKSDLKSETRDAIKVAMLGDSDEVKVGQIAIAIGNAQGMGQSVTVGYISAKDRELDMSDNANGGTKTMNFLQTDAAINGGNSGGPLVDINGNVVGINSAKISDTQVEGMCYAIPISSAIPIINELMNRETLTDDERGYLGISLRDVSKEAVQMYNVPDGVYVDSVSAGGPAEKAGIKEGDIITEINSVEVNSKSAASDKINSYRSGTEVNIIVYRQQASGSGYEKIDITATLGTAEEAGIDLNNAGGGKDGSGDSDDAQGDNGQGDYDDRDDMDDWFDGMFSW